MKKAAYYIVGPNGEEPAGNSKNAAIRRAEKATKEDGQRRRVHVMNWDGFGVAWPEEVHVAVPSFAEED